MQNAVMESSPRINLNFELPSSKRPMFCRGSSCDVPKAHVSKAQL